MNNMTEMLDKAIASMSRMVADNERMIAETNEILGRSLSTEEMGRTETRVLKNDGFHGAPDRLKDAQRGARASVVSHDQDTGKILFTLALGNQDEGSVHGAYTNEYEEMGVLRWMDDNSLVELDVCKKINWPDMDHQTSAVKKEVEDTLVNFGGKNGGT